MLTGIALFGVITANLAAFMLEHSDDNKPEPTPEPADAMLEEVNARLERIERLLLNSTNGNADHEERTGSVVAQD